jgi:hypothetical protein
MQAIVFQVNQMFCSASIASFVIECVVTLRMESVKEQRICVKFYFRVGKTTVETYNIWLQTYGDDTLS